MVLTVADVERWNAAAVRDVFHAANARGQATLEASRQLSTLSVFDSWEGLTAEARKHTNASIRQDLDAHGNESLAVAQAAGKAADDIEKVQSELRTLQHDASELHMAIDPVSSKIVPAEKMPPMEAEIAAMQLQPRLAKILAEANAVDAELAAAINMADGDTPIPGGPRVQFDPRNPFVDDSRFGHWVNVTPPPYTGATPPAPWTGHKSLEGYPGKGPGGPSGFYVPGGKTWADDSAAPMAYETEQYRFRISGEDYTGYTRMVGGQQQQWVQYTYDSQRYTQVNLGGAQAWAPKGPNETTGELGGVATGGLGGITPPPKIEAWQPISLPQIASLSGANPAATYYIPDGCGGQFTFSGGVPVGGMAPPPTIPSMIAEP
jgi:hypothetical protein